MAEKNNFAKFLDSLVERKKDDNDDVLNMLPKPNTQEFGNGFIVWKWLLNNAVVESVLVTRDSNETGLEKDTYVVNLIMPQSEEYSYTLYEDMAKELGSAILSAWNWKNVWKLHAGDFLLEEMQKEPVIQPEPFYADDNVEVVDAEPLHVETIEVDEEALRTTPTFDNG